MPRHRNITLVACEECRARKIRCDGTTPVCSACQTKSKTCTYASDPAVPRVAALKTAHKQLESKYDHLRSLYTRLKEADSADALALLEQIRTTDGIPELPENPSIWQSSSDTANTSGQASPMVSKEEDLTAIGESRFDVTDFSLTEGPACIPSDTNMHSSSGILHPSLERSDDTGPSVCQWNSRTGKRFDTHISVSHKVFLWPAVYRQFALGGAKTFPDLRPLAWVGSAWLMRKDELGVGNLPCDEVIPFSSITSGCALFPDLSFAQVENYSAAYFNTFNRLFPILDRNLFVDGVLTRLSRQGYKDDDPESVLALLVCALGQLAREGVFEIPASTSHGEPSGFRGGTTERPPGLSLFNQARRRVGIVATKCSLETVQILLLQGTYFEACARHTEFWSSVSAASMSCMLLVKSQPIHWSSRYGDLVKRAFWICVLHERSINLDFCVADTGIEALAELVPLPHFPDILDEERVSCNIRTQSIAETKRPTKSDFAYHLSAMISLGQLIRRANDVIHDHEPVIHDITRRAKESSAFANDPPVEGLSDPNDQGQIHFGLVRELAHELESWRKTLPSRFQWSDDRKFDFTEIDPVSELSRSSFFNLAGNAGPEEMDHNVDVAVAHLRTCYYQTRFLVYRPFIYKALHQPKLMTLSDRTNCAFAVEAACHWPISLAPPKNKMHLLPHLFSWTQNFLAILLILKFCLRQGPLHDICQENGVSDSYIRDTFVSMKAWLEDASQVDGIARWGLQVFL